MTDIIVMMIVTMKTMSNIIVMSMMTTNCTLLEMFISIDIYNRPLNAQGKFINNLIKNMTHV